MYERCCFVIKLRAGRRNFSAGGPRCCGRARRARRCGRRGDRVHTTFLLYITILLLCYKLTLTKIKRVQVYYYTLITRFYRCYHECGNNTYAITTSQQLRNRFLSLQNKKCMGQTKYCQDTQNLQNIAVFLLATSANFRAVSCFVSQATVPSHKRKITCEKTHT